MHRVESHLVPGTFDGHVDAETVALLTEERRARRRRRVENGGHVERLGARPSRRIGFRDVDGRSAGGAGTERRESADRAGARHEHAIAGAHAGTLDSVRRDRGRLDQCALRVRHALGESHDLVLGDRRELRHAAPGVGEPDAGHGCAEMLQPALAVGAMAAVGERHDRDSVALADAGDARAGRNDVACELVPEDLRILRSVQRVRLDRRHDRAGHVLMQIGAADTARHDPDDDLARARRGRLGDLLDADVMRRVESECPHRLMSAAARVMGRSARRADGRRGR